MKESIWEHYKFTEDEQKANAKKLAEKLSEKESLEDQFTSAKSQFKAKIDTTEAEIRDVRNKVASGEELRLYNCEIKLIAKTKTREYWDVNDGHLVKSEPFHAEDYQEKLPL